MDFHSWLQRIVKRQVGKNKDSVPVEIVEGDVSIEGDIDIDDVDVKDREDRMLGIVSQANEYNWTSDEEEPELTEDDKGATGYVIDDKKVKKWDGTGWITWMDLSEDEEE